MLNNTEEQRKMIPILQEENFVKSNDVRISFFFLISKIIARTIYFITTNHVDYVTPT